MRSSTVSRKNSITLAIAVLAGLRTASAGTATPIVEYAFTGNSFNPTTLAGNLTGSAFGYANANPGYPPSGPPFIVQGSMAGDPPYFVAQSDWFPNADGFNEDYYTFQVSVAPGYVFNASSVSFIANSRQAVLFDSQVVYSSTANFTSSTNFDNNPFIIPAVNTWSSYTASDNSITSASGTTYFRIFNQIDPNGSGTISDLLNMSNISLNGTVQAATAATNMYWDPGHTGTPGSGGTGTWSSPAVWADGAVDYAWSNTTPETANFGGPVTGTVTLGANIQALYGINFTTGGYTIAGAAGNTLTVAGIINAAPGATISANLTTPGSGTLRLQGGGDLILNGAAHLGIGTSLILNAGVLDVDTGGSLVENGANPVVASAVGDIADLDINNSGSFSTDSTLVLADQGGQGSVFMYSGTLSANAIIVGKGAPAAYAVGVFSQNGGTVTAPTLSLASGDVGSSGEYDLSAGTLATAAISGGPGKSQFDFYGGTLQATTNSTTFITSLTALNVEGGATAIIDTNGHNVTVVSPLINASSTPGALTKVGAGTLTLSSNPTYTGATTVSAGRLTLANAYSDSPSFSIASGATLEYADSVTTSLNPGTYTGTGTLLKTGAGKLIFGKGSGVLNMNFSSGALIDIEGGILTGSSSYSGNWTSNDASMNIASGATFDAVEAGTAGVVQIGALTGAGTFQGGYLGNPNNTSTVDIGVADGSGLFSGTLQDDVSAHLSVLKFGTGTETFSGLNTYTGGTSIIGGTLLLNSAQSMPNGALTIGAPGALKFATGIGGVNIRSLAMSLDGTFDLANNHLFINYGSGADPYPTVLADVARGYAGGTWTGAGLYSSTAAANPKYALGLVDSAAAVDLGLPSGTIEVAYALYGDINLDGVVNGTDFSILASHFGKTVTGGWEVGDLNYDGVVNGTDFGLLAGNFGKSASGQAIALPASQWAALDSFAAANGLLSDIPEPSSFSALLFAVGSVFRRRRGSRNSRSI
jgi:autotransporter-associated beta strand protein